MMVRAGTGSKIALLLAQGEQAWWAITSQVVTSGANFLLALFLLRQIGVEQFGRYSIYYLIALTLVSVLQSAIVAPAISIGALSIGDEKIALVRAMSTVYLGYSLIVLVAMGVADQFVGSASHFGINILIAGALFLALSIAEYLRRVLFLLEMGSWVIGFDVARYTLIVVFCGLILNENIELGADIFSIVVVACNIGGVALVVANPSIARQVMPILAQVRQVHRRVLKSGRWLAGTSILQFCNEHLFMIVGFAVVGANAVGLVRASQTLVGIVNPLLFSLENFVPLRIGTGVRAQGVPAAMASFRKLALVICIGFAAALSAIAAFSQAILDLVIGAEAAGGAWVLQALCLMQFLLVMRTVLAFPFRALERTRAIFLSLSAGAIFSVLAAYPLIYYLGIGGLLLGIVIAQAVSLGVLGGALYVGRGQFDGR